MKIAYLSVDDPMNHNSWSGLKLNIFNLLKKNKNKVDIIGPLKSINRLPYILLRELFKLRNIKYDSDRKIKLSKFYSKIILKHLKEKKYDYIFTSDTYLVSFLETEIPICLWLDTTYQSYFKHYFSDLKIYKKSFEEANFLEKLSLHKSKKIILTSNWAKSEAIKMYKLPRNKVFVVPFGSNLKIKEKNLINYDKRVCNLISVGVDWKRKGMDKTIKVCDYLNKVGLKINLTIVGKKNFNISRNYLNQVGFLDKNSNKDYIKLKNFYKNSDFHILLTNKEACGVVFAEANSFGLYNITHDVGGVGGMIKDNINGKMFKKSTTPKKIAEYIIKLFLNKKKFLNKRFAAEMYYKKNLSWTSNSLLVQNILKK